MYYTSKLPKIIIYFFSTIKLVLTKIRNKALPSKYILTPKEKFTIEEIEDSYKFFKKFFYKSIFKEQIELQHYIAKLVMSENSSSRSSSNNLLCLEFGVFKGSSINIFSNYLKNINYQMHGFDSFEGINEDWYGTSKTKKSFDNFGKIPKINSNVVIVKGLIQNTLPEFLQKNKEKKLHLCIWILIPTKVADMF
jgi:hypothetical protein